MRGDANRLPSGWKKLRLDQISRIVGGSTPSTERSEFWDGTIAWTTPKDLSTLEGSYLDASSRTITEAGLQSCAAEVLPPNSVLFSSRAPIGLVAINRIPVATNQGFKSFVVQHEVADAKYLYHWLKMNRSYLESLGNGATFKEVSKAIVSRVEIPVPPLTEQKRIAAILDQADSIRRKRQQAIRLTDDFLRSVFLDMFGDPVTNPKGWDTCALGDLTTAGDTINYGVIQPGTDYPGGVPLVRAGDIALADPDVTRLKTIDPEIDRNYDRSRLHGGEVLIGCVGAVGATCIAPISWAGVNIARAVARIRLHADIEPEFILALLRTEGLQRYFTEEIRVVAQPTLNIKQIKETRIIVPPASLRKQFASLASGTLLAREREIASATAADTLFQSLQHRAFTGQLQTPDETTFSPKTFAPV